MTDSFIAPAVTPLPKMNRWQDKLAYLAHQLRRSPLTMAGLLITLAVLLVMLFAPWLAPHDPNALNLVQRLAPSMSGVIWRRRHTQRSNHDNGRRLGRRRVGATGIVSVPSRPHL